LDRASRDAPICASLTPIGTATDQKISTRLQSDHLPTPRIRARHFEIPMDSQMNREQELALVRRAYAKEIVAISKIPDASVETAFAEVRREDFLDPGPWLVIGERGDYLPTPSADPAYLYLDHVVVILPQRHLDNGQPSLHAKLLAHAGLRTGEHAVHVGAGTGYYTAIMAHLIGSSGRVTGIELDPELAARARGNLASYPNVQVVCGNGAVIPFDTADVIYVNAGATRPAEAWLDGLAEGGRLILPLTTSRGFTRNDPLCRWRSAERYSASSGGHSSFLRGGFLLSRSSPATERAIRSPRLL
jgi:protein-L-isoaspartate O-methyltransferase